MTTGFDPLATFAMVLHKYAHFYAGVTMFDICIYAIHTLFLLALKNY